MGGEGERGGGQEQPLRGLNDGRTVGGNARATAGGNLRVRVVRSSMEGGKGYRGARGSGWMDQEQHDPGVVGETITFIIHMPTRLPGWGTPWVARPVGGCTSTRINKQARTGSV